MGTQTNQLNVLLHQINTVLKQEGLLNVVNCSDQPNELLEELTTLIQLLQEESINVSNTKSDSLSFFMYYLHLILGKKVNMTQVINLVIQNPQVLLCCYRNKYVMNLISNNLKGRLRRLSPNDQSFDLLASTLNQLGSKIPNDVMNRVKSLRTIY